MKLWKISPPHWLGYDRHKGAVVAANSADEARAIHPNAGSPESPGPFIYPIAPYGKTWDYEYGTWVESPADVTVEYLGEAKPGTRKGVVFSGFHAG
jgi:hypothetical protein